MDAGKIAILAAWMVGCTASQDDSALDGSGPVDAGSDGGGDTRGGDVATGDSDDAASEGDAPPADDGSSSDSGSGDTAEFCEPMLTAEAASWRAEYDALFSNTESMRTYLGDLPRGSGHWGQSYTLRSFALMYELTGDLSYLHELLYQTMLLREIAEGGVTWPTGVCGNTFSEPTVVIDTRLLEPMLRAAWWMKNSRLADDPVPTIDDRDFGGLTYGEVADEIAALAAAVLGSHEGDMRSISSESFGPYDGSASEYYRFASSYTCVSGDVMPFNYANSAGTAYARLYQLTGDEAALGHAERLMIFWWNRTYAYEPSPGATRSRWWGYRGKTSESFDPAAFPGDADQRPEDDGHADMSSSFAATMYALGLEGQNGTRIDQLAMTSKRWIDRAVSNATSPAYYITNDDTDGEWTDLFDHLPMSCYRVGILDELSALAPAHLTDSDGAYRRSHLENIAELAYFTEFAGTAPACGPSCGDGVCNGPEDCVGCPDDCGTCPTACG
jgi:hypothetical protein